jgi:hypothetical protein
MATVAKSIQKKAYNTYGMVCFFSGVKLTHGEGHVRQKSIEHLCPVLFGKGRVQSIENNHVPALRGINSLLGHCPLVVKFRLKEEIRKLTIFPGLDDDRRAQTYIDAARMFLDSYKVNDVFPWCWNLPLKKAMSHNAHTERKYRQKLRDRYRMLLTQEEIDAGFYVKGTYDKLKLSQNKG